MDYLAHHLLRASARRLPDKEAIVFGDERLDYAQLWRLTGGLAAGLQSAGLRRADRVGIYLGPSLALAASIFGVSRAGGVFVPIHHSLLADQVEHIARDCQMTALVTDEEHLARVEEVLAGCPDLKFVVLAGGGAGHCPRLAVHDYERLAASQPLEESSEAAIGRDLAAIIYTSGSTGRPKGVMLSHDNLIAGASIVSDYLKITAADRILAVLPFSFDAGLNQLTTAIQQGATCVLATFLFAKEIVAALAKERITGLAGVPSLWSLLAQQDARLKETPLPRLRYITNTGGALPQRVLDRLREALPETEIFLMYGLTEAFRSTYLPPAELERRPTSIGKAIPNTEILVVDGRGRPCGPGETGELVHRGPTVSLGYWGQPELTAQVLRPHPFPLAGVGCDEKVCYSGDLVTRDEDGYLYFVGRRDNLIKSSGFRVSPTEVEEGISKSGPVREAAVIGLPDEVLGQRIKAFVVLEEGAAIEAGELLENVAERLPRHMIPKSLEIVGELPKTSSGKVDYPALRAAELAAAPSGGG